MIISLKTRWAKKRLKFCLIDKMMSAPSLFGRIKIENVRRRICYFFLFYWLINCNHSITDSESQVIAEKKNKKKQWSYIIPSLGQFGDRCSVNNSARILIRFAESRLLCALPHQPHITLGAQTICFFSLFFFFRFVLSFYSEQHACTHTYLGWRMRRGKIHSYYSCPAIISQLTVFRCGTITRH